jgi:hypothetical protein
VPLSADNAQQSDSGSFTSTSGSATLPAGTDAGTTVLLFVTTFGTGTVTTPTGFVLDNSGVNAGISPNARIYIFRRSNVPAGESSWTITVSVSQLTTWAVREYTDLDPNDPKVAAPVVVSGSLGAGSETSTGQIYAANPSEDVLALAVVTGYDTGATGPTFAVGPTEATSGNNTTSTLAEDASGTDGTRAATIAVFEEFSGPRIGLFYTASTNFTRATAGNYTGLKVAYRAKGTALYPTLTHILGAQHGTSAGWTTGTAGFRYLESASAGVSITSTNPRHHTYAFRCNATTTACNFTSYASTIAAGVYVGRLSFRLNATPGANLELGGTVSGVTFRWIQSTGKIGCTLPGGSEQVSAAAVSASAWYSIDYRIDTSGTAWTCEWSTMPDSTKVITPETTATATGAANTSFQPRWGWTTATTGDVNFADLVGSSTSAAYPMGDYQVRAVGIDGSRAVDIGPGTSGNWGLMTANGTIGAWDAATAPTLMDELPATIGASADGVVMVTAATDVIGVYFAPITVAPTGTAKGARCCAIGWAASATASTVGARAVMGAAFDSIYAPVADYNFDNSTTVPAWVCSGVLGSGGSSTRITQALLTAGGNFQFGGVGGVTTDATPDVGFHAAYLELAVKITTTRTLFGGLATAAIDTDTSGVIGVTVDATSLASNVDLYYETNTTPTTVPVTAGTTATQVIDAPTGPTTNYIALYPPPEPDPVD